MSRTHRLRRALVQHLPEPGAVALALLIASFGVLVCVGIWSSRLGSPPTWSFDCSDTTCVDLWADARRRYLLIAAGAAAAGIMGWALVGASLSALPVPRRALPPAASGPGRAASRRPAVFAFGRLLVTLLVASALLWGAGGLAIAMSRPSGLAAAGLGAGLAGFAAWRWLRPGAASDRGAYWIAGIGIGGPVLMLLVFSLHPLLLMLEVLVLFSWPILGVLGLTGLLVTGTAIAGRLLRHAVPAPQERPVAEGSDGPSAMEPHGSVAAPSASGSHTVGPVRHHPASTAAAVGAIAVLAVLSARPLEAPPADAWMYAAPSSAAQTDGDRGGTGAVGKPSAPTDSGDTPTLGASEVGAEADASGLPGCDPTSLQVTAGGFDGWVGNSVATLTATNDGERSCALRGAPSLMLEQGDEEISLDPHPLTRLDSADQPAAGVALQPGEAAVSQLFWPGYRTAADQETPQILTLRLAPGGDGIPVALHPVPDLAPGPAPFDLKAGVDGGAVIEIGQWEKLSG